MSVLDDIRLMIKEGRSYEDLSSVYPLTKSGYKKLGGSFRNKTSVSSVVRSDPQKKDLFYSIFDCKSLKEPSYTKSFLVGTLLGDSHASLVTCNDYTQTACVKIGHAWSQLLYVKLKFELLGKSVRSVRVSSPDKGIANQDYKIYLNTKTSREFFDYHYMFYKSIEGKQCKYVFSESVANLVDYEALAFWVMDDGSSRSKVKGSIRIPIGQQDYYTRKDFLKFLVVLEDRLEVKFDYSIDKYSFLIYPTQDSFSRIFEGLKDYILPFFSYKINALPEECGAAYRDLDWFKNLEENRLKIEHPFFIENDYSLLSKEYKDKNKSKLEKYLTSRTIVRGFPYYDSNDEDFVRRQWDKVLRIDPKVEEKEISCSNLINSFPNVFYKNRFRSGSSLSKSPYDVFLDKKSLKKVISLQINSKDNINNSNIRNAICSYSNTSVGQFNVGISKFFVGKFCVEGGTVLDPCSGWGSRLTSCLAIDRGYYGIDVNGETVNNSMDLIRKVGEYKKLQHDYQIVCGSAEDKKSYSEGLFDFSITSPPFFSKEYYESNPDQSVSRYPAYQDWLQCFLQPLSRNVYSHLKPGSFFVFHIADTEGYDLVDDSKNICLSVGFILYDTYSLKKRVRIFRKENKGEVFLVFKKEAIND